MLMYGPSRCFNIRFAGEGVEFNFTSFKEGGVRLNYLIPYLDQISDDFEFDLAYANYIMNNDQVFVQFFQIIYNLYLGKDVFIAVDSEENWAENLLESLLKFIQERYGYIAIKIESEEDYLYARNNFSSDFNPEFGLYNLDSDKERFYSLIDSGNFGSNLNIEWNRNSYGNY